jgi:hypothetical protein
MAQKLIHSAIPTTRLSKLGHTLGMGKMRFQFKRVLLRLLERSGYTLIKNRDGKSQSVVFAMQIKSIQKNYRLLARAELYNRTVDLSGSIIEAGVGGGTGLATFALLEDSRNLKRKIWAFDSFSGFPLGTKEDSSEFLKSGKPEYEYFSEDYVLKVLRSIHLSPETLDLVTLCKGFMPQSFSQYDHSPVALLNLDVDLFQSTKDVLDFFWPLMESAGIVILDEYDNNNDALKWPGAKKAIDDFCVSHQIEIQRSIGNRAFLVKP